MKAIWAFLLFSTLACAQVIGIGGGASYPVGNFEYGVNFGYNAGLTLHLRVFGVHTVAYAAYGFWDEETVRDTDNNVTTDVRYENFPVLLAGARKYWGKFYLSAMAGIYPVDLKIRENRDGEIFEYNPSTTQGALVPGAGYMLPFAPVDLDFNLNYLWTEDYGQVLFTASVIL